MLATHSAKLERWLSPEVAARLSGYMKDWYGPPISVAGVPGSVQVCGGGDFRGRIDVGSEATANDLIAKWCGKVWRAAKRLNRRHTYAQLGQLNAGFASLSALINAATVNGLKQDLTWNKTGPTVVVGGAFQLWQLGSWPLAGAAGAAAPGGTVPTSATTGALPFNNVPGGSGDFNCIAGMMTQASAVNSLLLYDRLQAIAKTINSTGAEAVTGVPTRYTNTTAGQMDSIAGNFAFPVVGLTALANTAHNWASCTYKNQAGSGATFPSVAGNPGAVATIVHRLDLPVGTWFMPLASGDTGVASITNMQCSALVATGLLDFVVGHPLAMIPIPIAGVLCPLDGINTDFNLNRVFDNACLSHLILPPPATTATTFGGSISLVAG